MEKTAYPSFEITNKLSMPLYVYERTLSKEGIPVRTLKTPGGITGTGRITLDGNDLNYEITVSGKILKESTLSYKDFPVKNISIIKTVQTHIGFNPETGDEEKTETVTWNGLENEVVITQAELDMAFGMLGYIQSVQADIKGQESLDLQAALNNRSGSSADMTAFFNQRKNVKIHGADYNTYIMVLQWMYANSTGWQGTFYLYWVPGQGTAGNEWDSIGTLTITDGENNSCGTLLLTGKKSQDVEFHPGAYKNENPTPGSFVSSNESLDISATLQGFWKSNEKNSDTIVPGLDGIISGKKVFGTTEKIKPPDVVPPPVKVKVEKLSELIKKAGGGTLPPDLPDPEIAIITYKINEAGYLFDIEFELDLEEPAKTSKQFANLKAVLKEKGLRCHLSLDKMGNALISCVYTHSIPLPTGHGGPDLELLDPTLEINVNPLFKWYQIELKGDLIFELFGKKADATVSVTFSSIQIDIAASIKRESDMGAILPAPPVLKGIHVEQIGIEMGVFLEPEVSFDFGVQGVFQIGEETTGQKVKPYELGAAPYGTNDSFGIVFSFPGGIPTPVYASYYLEKIDLSTIITLFTDEKENISFPVSLYDYSMYYATEPIALPDGTTSPMGIGYSAMWKILDFSYYGKFEFNVGDAINGLAHGKITGLSGVAEAAPLSLGGIIKIKGDGKGVTQAFNSKGLPVADIQVANPSGGAPISGKRVETGKDSQITIKQLIPPGGPVLEFNLHTSPYFHLSLKVSFLDLEHFDVEATIGDEGIFFELDYGVILGLEMKIQCNLKSYDNFSGKFTFGIDESIPLPFLGFLGLGHLHLKADVDAEIKIQVKEENGKDELVISIGAGFDFEGFSCQIPDFPVLEMDITGLEALIKTIGGKIIEEVEKIFLKLFDVFKDAIKWIDRKVLKVLGPYAEQILINALKSIFTPVASFAEKDGSLFIFILLGSGYGSQLNLYTEGVAGAFGYNRGLKIPLPEQIKKFPIVRSLIDPHYLPSGFHADTVMEKIKDFIPSYKGQFFISAGMTYGTYHLINSYALITAGFGKEFEIALLGLAEISLKEGDWSPIIYAELALEASYNAGSGLLAIEGELTPASYIFSNDCALFGGFAFYIWFNGEHEGDFVVTLGGYNPNFIVPGYYPRVPRVGFNLRIGGCISIKGETYFALCAHALMAGGSLEAVWHSGPFGASFTVGADILIGWKPNYYIIDIHANLKVSYTFHFFGTHHIHVDVGADLKLWGPELAGKAHIHLWIVSFTVKFGDTSSPDPQPISWEEFRQAFLPSGEEMVSITLKGGLVKKDSTDTSDLGVINPKGLKIVTNSAIPSKGGQSGVKLGIAPMAVHDDALKSSQTITITKDGSPASEDFKYTPVLKNAPAALWGESLMPELNGARNIENTLAGFIIEPLKPPVPGKTRAILVSDLKYTTICEKEYFFWNPVADFQPVGFGNGEDRRKKIETTIMSDTVKAERNKILTSLGLTPSRNLTGAVAGEFLVAPQIEQPIRGAK